MKQGGSGVRYYVLAVLVAGYMLNSFDRSILSLLLEPIRLEFGATDTQLGLLSGLAFAAFYSLLSLPIAALADRWNRRNLLLIALLVWTLMTAMCGLAGSFVVLLLARAGVGIGEAGGNPTSHSLIADYFPAPRRATALGIYALGAPAGAMLAGLFGGWGAEHLGWRSTMLMAAVPGLLLAPLLFLTVAEPRRPLPAVAALAPVVPPLGAVLENFWSQRSFRHLCIACALHSLAMYSASSFNPAYLMRTHGWSGIHVGQLIALVGITGMIGTFLGGFVTDRLGARGETRWQLWVPGIATLAVIPVQIFCYLGAGGALIVGFMASSLLSFVFFGPAYATVQSLATSRTRAVAAATILFSKSMIGMGLGPLLVGVTSDLLAPIASTGSLRFALLLVPMFNLWAGIHFFVAARHLRADLSGVGAPATAGIQAQSGPVPLTAG